jgi:hypothetical protein
MSSSDSSPLGFGNTVFDSMESPRTVYGPFNLLGAAAANNLAFRDQFDEKAVGQHEKCDVAPAESDLARTR